MRRASSRIGCLFACLGLLVIAGCSDQPKAPPRFHLNPQQAAEDAMKLYDKNGDGTLDAKKLLASPPLAALLRNLKAANSNHPNSLTTRDIADRLEQWQALPTTLVSPLIMIRLDGKPLEGATVTYDPEPFLGPSYHAHQGQTASNGAAVLNPECKGYPGVYVGLYRVRVSKVVGGEEIIPKRYNVETVLGREAAACVPPPYCDGIFDLKSK
jgi:hypothetical protein